MSEQKKPLLAFLGKLPSQIPLGDMVAKTHCPPCMGLF